MCSLVRFFERNESEPERYIERAQSRYAEKVFRLVWERPVALFCRMFEHCLRSRTFYTDDLTEDGDKGWTFSLRRAQELIDDAKFLCANWDSSCELENCRLCVACCQRLPVLATENAQYVRTIVGSTRRGWSVSSLADCTRSQAAGSQREQDDLSGNQGGACLFCGSTGGF
jgi:hypothetical protein